MDNDMLLNDAEGDLKELNKKREDVRIEAVLLLSDGLRKVIDLYKAHQEKDDHMSFVSRIEDVAEDLINFVSDEADNLFMIESSDLHDEINRLIFNVQKEEIAHEKSYTPPY